MGGSPAITMAATMKIPARISEVETAGGLNLDPINLIKAETGNFFVPADVEVVIEGEFIPNRVANEGPYGAFVGYTKKTQQPVGIVKAITHRKDPIIPMVVDGTYPSDTEWLISIFESARLYRMLTRRYYHPIRWVNIIPDFALGVCMISMMNMYPGLAFRVARHAFVNSNLFDKIVFVDADLEPMSLQALTTRFNSRTHPTRAVHTIDGYPPTPLQWYLTKDDMEKGIGAGRVYMDSCWPAHWGPEDKPSTNCFEIVFPKEIRERIVRRWKEYGFKEDPIMLPIGSVFEG
jgi:4-hydroxy-3-polyprenylbenzoate decarboxylase